MFGRCENADVSFSVGDFGNLALAIIQLDLNTRSSSDLRGQRVRHVGDVPIDHQVRNFHVRLSLLLETFFFRYRICVASGVSAGGYCVGEFPGKFA